MCLSKANEDSILAGLVTQLILQYKAISEAQSSLEAQQKKVTCKTCIDGLLGVNRPTQLQIYVKSNHKRVSNHMLQQCR